MTLNNYLIGEGRQPRINRRINKKELASFYKKHLDNHIMHSAQWFSSALKWYQIHTYNNPYNIGRPNAELRLIIDYKDQLYSLAKGLPLIFWGIGKSDTEMEIVNFQLEKNGKKACVVGIDINYSFLRDFSNALKDKIKEQPQMKIHFLGLNDLFENISYKDIDIFNCNSNLHICLGNTVGNYDNIDDIIIIFRKNLKAGDLLLLGFQSNKFIESTLNRYRGNRYFETLITNTLSSSLKKLIKREGIKWNFNDSKQQIEAWVKDIQLFRSKKFDPKKLESLLVKNGFSLKNQYEDEFTTCLHLYDVRE